ncbi:MAG: hypothetical protein QOG37_823, partial [Mycobacterium sp.]|nr:hypothetical protein [Mycobacterium sp.]
ALVLRAQGDEAGYDELIGRFRARARALGFEPLAARVD